MNSRRRRQCALLGVILIGTYIGAWPVNDPVRPATTRVERLVQQMTLEEKIAMIHGAAENVSTDQGEAGYLPGIPRLGIPSLRLADGSPSVLTRVPSTALTATMGLAATFSREDAFQNGIVIGRDARALGQDVALQPFINIYRDIAYWDPTFSRGYNTFGEDPLLTGQIGAAVIKGIQSQGVMAQAKHYIGYDGSMNVVVDPQAFHEIYLAPFVDAVDAGVASIMNSYNRINGSYSSANSDLLNTVLRGALGFKGFVTSDWGAIHRTDNINAGMDLEMPGSYVLPGHHGITPFFLAYRYGDVAGLDGATGGRMPEDIGNSALSAIDRAEPIGMIDAVREGLVKEATIDQAVARILGQMERFGLLDGKSKHNITPIPIDADLKLVQKTAEDAAVLLKNEDHILPLANGSLRSLVLIGPGAAQTVAVGEAGLKALGFPERRISPYAAMVHELASDPASNIRLFNTGDMVGVPIPASVLSHESGPGLLAWSSGESSLQVREQLDNTLANGKAYAPGSEHKWYGLIRVEREGSYILSLQFLGARARLIIDGNTLAESPNLLQEGNLVQANQDSLLPTPDGLDNMRVRLMLKPGPHRLQVTVKGDNSGQPVQVRLNWVTPEQHKADWDAAIAAAKNASAAVVFVWSRGRPAFEIPGDQNRLVEAVAAVNPHTIVVLNSSEPAALPWLSKVKAVLQMWYPGDAGGPATARLLLGRVSPSGRLPFTWGAAADQYPAQDPSHPERSSKGVDGITTYSEGIFVGYRWFDLQKSTPLFPFGFGLSYTSFEYAQPRVTSSKDGGIDVSFSVKNTGLYDGDEVSQLYIGPATGVPDGVQMAVRSLIGFTRFHLTKGETQQITIHVPLRRLEYWSTAKNTWVRPTGSREIFIGPSSRDFPLRTEVSTN